MTEDTKGPGRCLLEHLQEEKLTEYGSIVSGEAVREVLGIEIPAIGTQEQFSRAALAELNAIDYCRNVLLGEGKFLMKIKGDYLILLPSQNLKQVERYHQSALLKIRRASKLLRNTPTSAGPSPDTLMARLLLTKDGLENRAKFGEVS